MVQLFYTFLLEYPEKQRSKNLVVQKTKIVTILLSLFVLLGIARANTPPSIVYGLDQEVPVVEIEIPDNIKQQYNQNPLHLKQIIQAYRLQIGIDMNNHGRWDSISSNLWIWRVGIKVKESNNLGLFVKDYKKNDFELYTYTADYQEFEGPVNSFNFYNDCYLTQSLNSDLILIEVLVRSNSKINTMAIDELIIGIKPQGSSNKAKSYTTDDCYIDINCPEGLDWQNEKRSVCKIEILKNGGKITCTGTLLNNKNENLKPYLLTAYHCIEHQSDASNSKFIFGYEANSCNDSVYSNLGSIMGSSYVTSNYKKDYTLVELSQFPSFELKPYFAGWTNDTNNISKTVCIHHPIGKVKNISLDNDPPQKDTLAFWSDNGYLFDKAISWTVNKWDKGITEHGSSGSPMFSTKKQYIGMLFRGESYCGYPYYDNFVRMDAILNDTLTKPSIISLLNPQNVQKRELEPFEPFNNYNATCDTLYNIGPAEFPVLQSHPNGGYYSGVNGDSIFEYAEIFSVPFQCKIRGIYFKTAINTGNPDATVIVKVYSDNGGPNNVINQISLPIGLFKQGQWKLIDLYPMSDLDQSKFFIGFEIKNFKSGNFALFQSNFRKEIPNTQWIKEKGIWKEITDYNPSLSGSSMAIKPIVCFDTIDTVIQHIPNNRIQIIPIPAKTFIKVSLPEKDKNAIFMKVYDITGKSADIEFYETDSGGYLVNIEKLYNGFYLLQVTTSQYNKYNQTFIVIK